VIVDATRHDGNERCVDSVFLEDIEAADHVLVNSEFVKSTFQMAEVRTDNVHVLYLGVDNEFASSVDMEALAASHSSRSTSVARILFAGGFNERKGGLETISALSLVPDQTWHFTIAGNVDLAASPQLSVFLEKPNVFCTGWLTRPQLAKIMMESDIFLFPSRAEGSARVIFEALAAGCYVITTEASGSIVKNGVHGTVLASSDPILIARAISEAIANLAQCRAVGRSNAILIRERYQQADYGRALACLYDRISELEIARTQ